MPSARREEGTRSSSSTPWSLTSPHTVTLRLAGVLNRDSSLDVETFLLHRFARGHRDLVLDLTDVTETDGEGVDCLLTLEAHLRQLGGRLRVVTGGRGPASFGPAVAAALLPPKEATRPPPAPTT
jgi:anti-anti-sigma regulatory factor